MQDLGAARSRRGPLVGVEVHAVDVWEEWQKGDGGLLGGLAGEEAGGGGGEDDADGEGGMVGEGGDDELQFDRGDATAAVG
jgi:hypothetical protein